MAVTAAQYTQMRNAGFLGDGPVGAAITLYDLTMCFIDATDGQLTNVINGGANKLAGIVAQGGADNSAGADGDVDGEFYQEGEFLLTGSGFAADDVGKKIYATDNYAVHLTSTSRTYIGTVTKFASATQVWVKIDVQLP